MAFKSKTSSKGMSRSKPLQAKASIKAGQGFKAKPATKSPPAPPSLAEQRKAQQQALQKSTLKLLERARKEATEAGVPLSEWEGEFLESVSDRVRTYGRAFADPDKGAVNGTLSVRQGIKLREIRKKARRGKLEDAEEK
ncbi:MULTISPECIES: hypothetical protein [Asticcacaulis]|uniref:hypothetical protein n=1 Tax=Asticcacaulis TaxID=76890 RepID=UPI001AE813B7|nr:MULTISPECIES: hypothetical protein [Asticcacaulis]MBP2158576.1 hypothetical protein [Asticcacaulis solisilvae]MDR6799622.1 hypothetical protein [Asticcacaulis sp. BE141]